MRGEVDPDRVADRLGVPGYLALLQARYRAERAAYHALRRRVADLQQPAETCGPDGVLDLPPPPDPLADDVLDAAVALVRHTLGGVVIDELIAWPDAGGGAATGRPGRPGRAVVSGQAGRQPGSPGSFMPLVPARRGDDRNGGCVPSLTEVVHAELGQVPRARRCCQRAEIATILRFLIAVGPYDGRPGVDADLHESAAARRLHTLSSSVFGYPARLQLLPADRPRQPGRHRVSVGGGDTVELARRVGLLDGRARPVRGLPPAVIGGPGCDAAAVWRAALLTSGRLAGPGHRAPLQVHPPDQLVALALVGAARRLEVTARSAETRGRWRVVVPDDAQVVALLERIGAPAAARSWQQSPPPPTRPPTSASGCDGTNPQPAAVAGLTAAARVRAALAMLGENAPAHLLDAGRLRLAHPQATLQQLGALTDPPISKDAVAGRIRRLLALADTHAASTEYPPPGPRLPPSRLTPAALDSLAHRCRLEAGRPARPRTGEFASRANARGFSSSGPGAQEL